VRAEKLNFREFLLHKPIRPQMSDWEVVNLYFGSPNTKISEISKKSGKSVAEIYRILYNSGSRPNRQITNHHNVLLFADSGLPTGDISKLTGYTERHVRRLLNKK
jgi:hypothetical protein